MRPRSLIKAVSRAVSGSPVGRRLHLGNRIVTWAQAA
jgi:hypothetical protein